MIGGNGWATPTSGNLLVKSWTGRWQGVCCAQGPQRRCGLTLDLYFMTHKIPAPKVNLAFFSLYCRLFNFIGWELGYVVLNFVICLVILINLSDKI